MRDYVVQAWQKWVSFLRDLNARGVDLRTAEQQNAKNATRAQAIADPAKRAEVLARVKSNAAAIERQKAAFYALVSRAAEVHAVLFWAVKYYDATVLEQLPPPPSFPAKTSGVGVVFTLPVILAAVAAVAALVGSLAALAYYIGASKRNAEAETKIIDGILSGRVTPSEGSSLLGKLKPEAGGIGLFSVPWYVWAGGAAFVAYRVGLFGRRRA